MVYWSVLAAERMVIGKWFYNNSERAKKKAELIFKLCISSLTRKSAFKCHFSVKNGRYPFSENGDIRSLLSVQK